MLTNLMMVWSCFAPKHFFTAVAVLLLQYLLFAHILGGQKPWPLIWLRRPLNDAVTMFLQLADPYSSLCAVTELSCFSDRNIWDFLRPEAAVSCCFPPLLCSKPLLSDTKYPKMCTWWQNQTLPNNLLDLSLVFFSNLFKLKSVLSHLQAVCIWNLTKHSPWAIIFPAAVPL